MVEAATAAEPVADSAAGSSPSVVFARRCFGALSGASLEVFSSGFLFSGSVPALVSAGFLFRVSVSGFRVRLPVAGFPQALPVRTQVLLGTPGASGHNSVIPNIPLPRGWAFLCAVRVGCGPCAFRAPVSCAAFWRDGRRGPVLPVFAVSGGLPQKCRQSVAVVPVPGVLFGVAAGGARCVRLRCRVWPVVGLSRVAVCRPAPFVSARPVSRVWRFLPGVACYARLVPSHPVLGGFRRREHGGNAQFGYVGMACAAPVLAGGVGFGSVLFRACAVPFAVCGPFGWNFKT